jgi:hypothetical protein
MKTQFRSPETNKLVSAATDTEQLKTATVCALLSETETALKTDQDEELFARQAGSCLLAPAMGDRVLVFDSGDETFVLAVLERNNANAAEISVPGAPSLRFNGKDKIELNATAMRLTTRKLHILAEAVVQSSETITINATRIVETIIDKFVAARSVTTKAETRCTDIEKVDTVSVGTLVQKVDGVATQSSEISMITAKRDVRLDAERVSVG